MHPLTPVEFANLGGITADRAVRIRNPRGVDVTDIVKPDDIGEHRVCILHPAGGTSFHVHSLNARVAIADRHDLAEVLAAWARVEAGRLAELDLLDGAYVDTAGHAFHPGADQSAGIEVAVDATGSTTRKLDELARFVTAKVVERRPAGTTVFPDSVVLRLDGAPDTTVELDGKAALVVRPAR